MYRNLYHGEVSALNFTLSLWRGAGSTSQASLEAWGALAELLSPPGLIPEYGTENSPEEAREITVIVVYWLDMWTGSRSKRIIFRVTFAMTLRARKLPEERRARISMNYYVCMSFLHFIRMMHEQGTFSSLYL
jgi:hypothetical protein